MKTSRAVVLRYARALLELGDERCIEMLRILANLKDERIKSFINDPTVLPTFKARMVARAFGVDERCQKMLQVIFEHKRFKMFDDLYKTSWKLWLRKSNKEEVKIKSAQELDEDELKEITKIIKRVRKSEPVLNVLKDEELLAGIIIDFEDSVIDMSAAGALRKAASLMYGG